MNFKKLTLILLSLVLSACTHPMYQSAQTNIDDARTQIATAKDNYATPQKSDGKLDLYRQAQKRRNPQTPAWLKRSVNLHVKGAPFAFVAEKIVTNTPAVVAFAGDIDKNKSISFAYRGTVQGALRALEAKSNYGYSVNYNTLTWSEQVSKTFDISFMPGASNYLLGQRAALANTNTESATRHVSGEQFSNLQATLSVWEDLNRTLHQLKSKKGQVFVSQATTTVTVNDKPHHVRAMANYIDGLNRKLSREVALQVQVLEVDLNRGFNYGIDWQLVRSFMNVKFGLQGSLAKPVTLTSLGSNTNDSAAGFIIQSTTGAWAGTDLLINALSQQGKISTVTRPRVVTLNNQVAQIDINTQTGYLKEVTTTTVGAASTSTTSLTPGTVKTGFSLYLLPKIQRKNVYLQISSTISTLLGITSIKANPNMFATSNTQIQLPTVSEKRFNQRTLIPSGSTLVLAGFKQVRNDANHTKVFKLAPLGSRGAQQTNTETIVLITPTVIDTV